MKNIDFLRQISSNIINDNNHYYAYVPLILGYANGYDKGLYILLKDEILNDEWLKEYVENFNTLYENEVGLSNEGIILSKTINDESNLDSIYNYEQIKSNDYEYYSKLNVMNEQYQLTEEQVNSTYKTFASIINEFSYVDDISLKTQVYKKVLEYYANGMFDETITSLKLIMSSSLYKYNDTSNYTNCGCNASTSENGIQQLNCYEQYISSIELYMKQMFGDIDFYNNFMFLDTKLPNVEMIDKLINLLESLKALGYRMNFDKAQVSHCYCPENESINLHAYNIIDNYINVLNWIKNCKIEENSNKIKVYGEQFGEIFSKLSF